MVWTKEYTKEYHRKYREKNKNKLKSYDKDYRISNRENLIKYASDYRNKNKNKFNEYIKEWRKKNKLKEKQTYLRNRHKHLERRFLNGNPKRKEIILSIIGNKCKICGKDYEELHHLGYENLPRENLEEYSKFIIPLCRECHNNLHKDLYIKNISNN